VVAKLQQVPVEAWFFTGVVFRSITVVNLRSSPLGRVSVETSPVSERQGKTIKPRANARKENLFISNYLNVG